MWLDLRWISQVAYQTILLVNLGLSRALKRPYRHALTHSDLDHDDFGLNQSKVIVIDSKGLELDAGGKPGATFPHPALVVRPQRLVPKRWDESAHKINMSVDRFDLTVGYHPSESIH